MFSPKLKQRTECNLKEKQLEYENLVRKEVDTLNTVLKQLKKLTSDVEERLKLLFQTDCSFGTLFGIRENISTVLDKLNETFNKSYQNEIMLESLKTLEKAIRLESVAVPLFDQHIESINVFKVFSKSLDEISKKLRSEHTKAIFVNNKDKARDECFSHWKDLLIQLVNHKFFYSGQIESVVCKELHEFLQPMVIHEPSKFIRPIPHKRFTVVGTDDPYEDENELLDKVIIMRDTGISFLYQLTYRYFSNPSKLFTELCTRFCVYPVEDEQDPELYKKTTKFKELVLEFILSWIHNFYYPDINKQLQNDIKKFVEEVVNPSSMYFNSFQIFQKVNIKFYF